MKLDLATVDQREKVPPNEQEHRGAEAEYQHSDNRYDGPPAQQHRQDFQISPTQPLEAAVECGGHPREEAWPGPVVRAMTLILEQQTDRDRRQGPRQ